jgi:hypothetical protein
MAIAMVVGGFLLPRLDSTSVEEVFTVGVVVT